jgi:hypothetical protein
MASRLEGLLARARQFAAERDRLVAEVAQEWADALRGQPLTEEDLTELLDGLTEEAVRRIKRGRKGQWQSADVQEAASRVARAVRERVQQDLGRGDQMRRSQPPGDNE